jgi:hypothetical protein
VIPEHARDDILEVRLARVEEPQRVFALYTKHKPGYKRADVDLFKLRPRYGEMFEVGSVRGYGAPQIAEDYNAADDRPVRNTRMKCEGGSLSLVVDGSLSVELAKMRLRTYQSELILEAELGDSGTVKMTKSLAGYCMRLRGSSVVHSITSVGGGMLLTYAQRTDDHWHKRHLNVAQVGENPNRLGLPISTRDLIEMVARPNTFEGKYVGRVSEQLRAGIISRLVRRMPYKQYTEVRGDIGEELVDLMLTREGCVSLEDHPDYHGERKTGSNRKGPDNLRRIPRGGPAYFEGKWWGNPNKAYSAAVNQVNRISRKDRNFGTERIIGAYIAIIDWSVEEEELSLTVKRVW